MSDTTGTTAKTGLEAIESGGDAMLGMATLGKTAAALALIIGLILLCTFLLRRLGPTRFQGNHHLRVVASTAVGSRERVAVVELEDTWLVVGVGNGQVSHLHSMPAPEPPPRTNPQADAGTGEGFATRFARALKHNAGRSRDQS